MPRQDSSHAGRNALILVTALGLALNIAIVLDLEVFQWLFSPPATVQQRRALPSNADLERLRASIVLVKVGACPGQTGGTGTGFVIASGFAATAAHVVGNAQNCGSEIRVVDGRGVEFRVELEGVSQENDLALLRLPLSTLAPLPLADSQSYELTSGLVPVLTIGYPMPGVGSAPGPASPSGDGNLSRYDSSGVFLVSGINFNPGNSGGPVFVKSDWKVLGMAVATADPSRFENLGVVVPARTIRRFFRERTGREVGS